MADGEREAEQLGVFISYSRRDCLDFADQVAKALDMLGYRPILDREGISAGEEWKIRLGQMILECDTVVFVMSPESAVSPVCAWEVDEAARLSKRILPIIAMPLQGKSPPERLQRLNYIYFYGEPNLPGSGFGDGLAKLNIALKSDVEWLREHRNLLLRAEAWEERKRDPDRLLRGGPLAEAERWLASRPVTAPDITPTQRAYLDASRAAEDADAAARRKNLEERERLLAESEAAQKRAAAEQSAREAAQREAAALREAAAREAAEASQRTAELAQREASQARKTARRTMAGLVAALVLSVVAGSAGYMAYEQQKEADKQRQQAVAQREEAEKQKRQAENQSLAARMAAAEATTARNEAEATRTRLIASLATDATARGDPAAGIALALELLPDADSSDPRVHSRPWSVPAERALGDALSKLSELARLEGHTASVLAVAVTRDGKHIVSGSSDNTVRIWDAEKGAEVRVLKGHTGSVYGVALMPDGKRIASVSWDDTLRIWDAEKGIELAVLKGHTDDINTVAISADGTWIATGADDGTIRIWDGVAGKELRKLEGHSGTVYAVAFSPDGTRVVSGASDRTIRTWDAATGAELRKLEGHTGSVRSVALTPDGTRIVSGGGDRTIRIWDAATGTEQRKMETQTSEVRSVAVAPDGKRIVSASADRTIRIWDVATGAEIRKIEGHSNAVNSVALAADGSWIVTGSEDRTVRTWASHIGAEIAKLEGHSAETFAVAVSIDGRHAVSASTDKTLIVWDLERAVALRTLTGHTDAVRAVAFTRDGKIIISGADDRTLRIWDASTGAPIQVLTGHTGEVYGVAVSPDGKHIVSASWDDTIRVWDLASGAPLATLKGHVSDINTVAISSDGSLIVSGADDSTVRIWDAASAKELRALEGHSGFVLAVALTPDGTRIVSSGDDRTIRIWDVKSGRELLKIDDHSASVRDVAISHDGRRIVSSSDDQSIRIWDLDTGEEIARLRGHGGGVGGIALAPDGTRIVSTSSDRTVRIWHLAPTGPALVNAGKQTVPRCLSPGERRRSSLNPKPPAWCAQRGKWPYSAAAAARLGEQLVRDDKLDEIEDIRQALADDNASTVQDFINRIAQAHVQRGREFHEAGRETEAEAQFNLALKRDASILSEKDIRSARAKSHVTRGQRLLGENKVEEAEVQFALAIKQDAAAAKDVSRAYVARGDRLLDDARSDAAKAGPLRESAMAMFQQALAWARREGSDQVTLANAVQSRGRAQDARGQYAEAIADFREAQQLGNQRTGDWLWWTTTRLATQRRNTGKPAEALLVAVPNYLDLTADVRKSIESNQLLRELNSIAYPLGNLHAELAARQRAPDAAHGCDRLASHPNDPLRVAGGTAFEKIDIEEAIAACTKAIEAEDGQGRFYLQRARASTLAGDRAREKKDDPLAQKHFDAALADLETAMASGYPIAFNNMAIGYGDERFVKKDEAKAADFWLQYFNHVLACCTALAARHLIEIEEQHDVATGRRVVAALLAWSAALGSEASRALHAELIAGGKLPAAASLPAATFTDLPPWLR